jgi:hypothetical protein
MNLNRMTTSLLAMVRRLPLWLVAALALYFTICAWYNVLQFTVFAGDDLRSFTAARGGFSGFNGMMISFYKFRPLTALFLGTVAQVTNNDFRGVASISLMLHAVNGLLFLYLLYRKIRLPLFVSIPVAATAVFNRFCTYLFMQDSALTCGLGIALLLLILIVAWPFFERPTVGCALCLVLLYAAIIHTYEPYLGLGLPLFLLGVCAFRRNRLAASVVSVGATGAALLNFAIKKAFLGTPVLIGTETQPITFYVPQILLFIWRGVLNLFGINSGPTHLSLEDFPESPWWIRIVSITIAAISFALGIGIVASILISEPGEKNSSALMRLLFLASAIGALLLAASITFRQMYSWLYPPYLVFLAFLAFGAQFIKARRWLAHLGLACLILLSIPRELYLRQRHSQFFAFQAEEIANKFAETLHHLNHIGARDAILIRGDVPSATWVFLDGTFSRFYHLPQLEFIDRNAPAEQTDQLRVVVDYNSNDGSFRIADEPRLVTNTSTHRMSFGALQPSAAAFVPSDKLSTPTKTPEFPITKNGVECMVEVSPVEVTVPVPPAATVLHVSFSHFYAMGDGADIEIAASSETGSTMLLSRRVPPLTDNDAPVWRKYEFTLPRATREVVLRILSKSDSLADWIVIRDFSFD